MAKKSRGITPTIDTPFKIHGKSLKVNAAERDELEKLGVKFGPTETPDQNTDKKESEGAS